MTTCDLAIVGLGAVGSAALLAAARAGVDVIGVDRFAPPHTRGSTHGETRIVRAAIGEGAHYSPLALRSFALWDQLHAETGAELVTRCGALILGGVVPHATHVGEGFLATTIAAARAYDIPHEILSAADVRARFPAFQSFDGGDVYFEPGAGYAAPEIIVAQQLDRARKLGAMAYADTQVLALQQTARGVHVRCAHADITAQRVIVCAGAWIRDFLPPAWASDLTVSRQTLHWFEVAQDVAKHAPALMPVFIWSDVYGFPMAAGPGGGIKIATEDMAAVADPDTAPRDITVQDIAAIEVRARAKFPRLGRHLRATVCLYTTTPDGHFRVGIHPDMDRVQVVSACSGHGFKHAAAVGEAMVTDPAALDAWRWPVARHR